MSFTPKDELSMKTINVLNYDLIIFDCDGTLVDSELISNRIVGEMFREAGVNISNDEAYNIFAGTSFQNITDYIESKLNRKINFDFEKTFRIRTKAAFESELKAVSGVEQFIENLSSKICVASNGPQEKMHVTLTVTGLTKYFSPNQIFSAYDIQAWKPDPQLFLFAADKMNTAPSKTLVIEDTLTGVMGAINAQMDVLAYTGDKSDQAFIEKQIPTFNSFETLSKTTFEN